jgi:hypothetical protein
MAAVSGVNELAQRRQERNLAKQKQFEFVSVKDVVRALKQGSMISS